MVLIKRRNQLVLGLFLAFNFVSTVNSQDDQKSSNPKLTANVNGNKGNGVKDNGALSPNPVPKFGEVPTNRVLPVDLLTDADYEDEDVEQNEIGGEGVHKDYCRRLLRNDLIKVVKKLKGRTSRLQEEEASAESKNPYLEEFDVSQLVSPLLNIMGSAIARNTTAIDMHYRTLPNLLKTEVTDFISLFTELLKIS